MLLVFAAGFRSVQRSQPARGRYALSISPTDGLIYGYLQLLAVPDGHDPPQLRTEQRVERLGQLAADVVVIVNQQPTIEGEVELPPERVGCLAVGRPTVSDPCQCSLEIALGPSEVALDFSQAAFGAVYLPCQPFLLAPEQVEWHSVGVVSIEQLLALGEQADQPALLHPPFALTVEPQTGQFFFEEGSDLDQLLFRELHRRVVPGDGILDLLDAQRPQLAVGPLLLPPKADEVGVGAASAFGMADDQPRTTLPAVDRALQVVRVVAVALARQVLGGHQLLDPLPGVVVHQRLMLALIEHALVANDADVVGVPQQPMEMGDSQRSARRSRAGNRSQAPLSQLV